MKTQLISFKGVPILSHYDTENQQDRAIQAVKGVRRIPVFLTAVKLDHTGANTDTSGLF